MKKTILFLFFAFSESVYAQPLQIEWQHCIGGTGYDIPLVLVPSTDGNFLMVGNTSSTDGVCIYNHGSTDILVCMFDSSGTMLWRRCFGGVFNDVAYSAVRCSDGGYIIAGTTNSYEGDVSGYHFSIFADPDGWIVKLDAAGNLQWQKCVGGSGSDILQSVIQLSDGNFLFAGRSNSNDGGVYGNHDTTGASYDGWVVKVNSYGNIIWQKCYGNNAYESLNSIIETQNHRYVFAGFASSLGDDIYNFNGYLDAWLAGTDTSGSMLFSKCYGGTEREEASSVTETSDGGFFISGLTSSANGDVTGFHGGFTDCWLIKTDTIGNLRWATCAGGSEEDNSSFGIQTTDDGYYVIGLSGSNDGDLSSNYGGTDVWLIKLDSAGSIAWQKNYGGSQFDRGISFFGKNGALFVTASTESNDFDVSLFNGNADIWIVKLSVPVSVDEPISTDNFITIAPNPSHGKISVHMNSTFTKNTILELEIMNEHGATVLKKNKVTTVSPDLSVENLSHGIYFLKLTEESSGNYFTKKFIVE